MPYFFDSYYFILIIPAMIIAAWAQARVSSTFNRYSRVPTQRGLTGYDAARSILDANGLYDIQIERVSGKLTDHYDPGAHVIRLSDSVYQSASVASVGVAAHEAGHAVQYAEKYLPITVRAAIIPITQIGSNLSIPLILAGVFLSYGILINIGIILFATVTVFQLVTLPVEYNASRRAIATLSQGGYVTASEEAGVRKVLNAAALTYVAALIVAIANLLRLILLFGGRRDY